MFNSTVCDVRLFVFAHIHVVFRNAILSCIRRKHIHVLIYDLPRTTSRQDEGIQLFMFHGRMYTNIYLCKRQQ